MIIDFIMHFAFKATGFVMLLVSFKFIWHNLKSEARPELDIEQFIAVLIVFSMLIAASFSAFYVAAAFSV